MDTAITSWDSSIDGPDERLEGRAYIAALSAESSNGNGIVYTSRMDVLDSEISYLGNEGDYHNDIGTYICMRQKSENMLIGVACSGACLVSHLPVLTFVLEV